MPSDLRISRFGFCLFTQAASTFAAVSLWASYLEGYFAAHSVVRLACAVLPLQLCWILFSWKVSGRRLFSPYSLFVASMFLFNAGQGVLENFGLNENGLLRGQFTEHQLALALLLVLYALSSMHLGALVASSFGRLQYLPIKSQLPDVVMGRVALVLLAIALFPSMFVWGQALKIVIAGGYGALYHSAWGSSGPMTLAGFLVPSAFMLLVSHKHSSPMRKACFLMVSSYILLQLFLGFRGNAMIVLASFLWLWHRSVRRISPALLASLFCTAVVVLPLIGAGRGAAGEERLSFQRVIDSYVGIGNPAIALLSEMGSSMSASAYTMQIVPAEQSYGYGTSYGYALLSLVPNLFWDVHPAAVHSPSRWLVETVSPSTAQAGGGFGFSAIAEGYLNFGFLGTGFPLGLLGWVMGRVSRWSEADLPRGALCFVAIALIPILIYGRAEAGNVVRGAVWFTAIPYVVVRWWAKYPWTGLLQHAVVARRHPEFSGTCRPRSVKSTREPAN